MHTFQALPEGYQPLCSIDLQKNKKLATMINLAALFIGLAMAAAALPFVPLSVLFDIEKGTVRFLLRFAALLAGILLYLLAHELTHAAAMKVFGAKHFKFGFTGLYAYAGSPTTYFDRRSYLCTALAPLLIWGIVFSVLTAVVPRDWFWVAYWLQIVNVSGAAGDVYVAVKTIRAPKGTLAQDDGVSMRFYAPDPAGS